MATVGSLGCAAMLRVSSAWLRLPLAILPLLGGAACRPVCDGQGGRCLDLRIEGDGAFERLDVLVTGGDLGSGTQKTVVNDSPQAVSLPTRLRVLADPVFGALPIDQVRAHAYLFAADAQPMLAGQLALQPSWLPGEHRTGTISLGTYITPMPGDMMSPDLGLSYDPSMPPVLTSFAPLCGPQAGGQGVRLNGSNFGPSTRVLFGGQMASPSESSGVWTVSTPPATTPGGVMVQAQNQGGSLFTAPGMFRYLPSMPTFTQPLVSITPPLMGNLQAIASADLNGDSRPDLVIGTDIGEIIYLLNQGGSFKAGTTSTITTSIIGIDAADFNNDGFTDLVVTGYGGINLYILIGQGGGSFKPAVAIPTNPTSQIYASGVVSLNDGDKSPDLVAVDYFNSKFLALRNEGSGSFLPFPMSDCDAINVKLGDGAYSVAVGDVDNDGLTDLVGTSYSSGNLYVCRGLSGGPAFAPVKSNSLVTGFTGDPQFMRLGDLDGDGKLDLAVGGQWLVIQHGKGDGSFQPLVLMNDPKPTSSRIAGLKLVDLDCDGRPEVVALVQNLPAFFDVYVYHCNASTCQGNKATRVASTATSYPNALTTGDWNGDGIPDLAVLSATDLTLLMQQ